MSRRGMCAPPEQRKVHGSRSRPDTHRRADVIVVMEKRHKERLRQKYPEEMADKRCICLFIADDYEFMDAGLVKILREKMEDNFPVRA